MANQNVHHTFPMEATKVQCPLYSFPELAMKPNFACLLLTTSLSPLTIWLAEIFTLFRKNPLLIFSCFSGFSSTCTYYRLVMPPP